MTFFAKARWTLIWIIGLTFLICLSSQETFAASQEKPTAQSITHYLMGLVFDWYDLTTEAISEYEKALRFDPDSFAINLKLGANYARVGQFDNAVKTLGHAQDINPKSFQTYYLLALIYSAQGEFDKAALEYEKILVNFPHTDRESIEIYAYLGQLYYSQNKFDKALEQFKLISKLEPDNVEIIFLLGSLCIDLNQRDEAVIYFKKAISLDPDHQNSLNSIAYIYAEDGVHLDEAIELIQRALTIEPENGAFLDSLGWIYYKKGMYEKALESLEQANSFFADTIILEHLGDVYYKMGQKDSAKKNWEKSLELAPDREGIINKLKALKKGEQAL
ncbi:MAG: tetratricopeptide repeat protein [Candidatus Omnitrophota bacterium]